MSIFAKFALEVLFATDSTEAKKLFHRSESIKDEASFSEFQQYFFTLASGAVDEAVNLDKLTNKESIVLFCDRQITVKLNDQAYLVGRAASSGGVLILTATSFSTLKLSNSSGGDAEISVAVAGS